MGFFFFPSLFSGENWGLCHCWHLHSYERPSRRALPSVFETRPSYCFPWNCRHGLFSLSFMSQISIASKVFFSLKMGQNLIEFWLMEVEVWYVLVFCLPNYERGNSMIFWLLRVRFSHGLTGAWIKACLTILSGRKEMKLRLCFDLRRGVSGLTCIASLLWSVSVKTY